MDNNKEHLGVLIIDEKPDDIDLLKSYLENNEYNVFSAKNESEIWQTLEDKKDSINVIILDYMMPGINSLEFLKRLQLDDSLLKITVIIQIDKDKKDILSKYIDAGVYHNITKPYREENIIFTVLSATKDHLDYINLRTDLEQYKPKLHLVKESFFEISTLGDAKCLATFLANFYPEPERVIFGLSELMINAVEHGNLGITYDEKTDLIENGMWEKEVVKRQLLKENINKKALVHFKHESNSIIVKIKDEGKGFKWQDYIDIDPDRAVHCHGRGITLSKIVSFDEMEYIGCGNEVVCKVLLNRQV